MADVRDLVPVSAEQVAKESGMGKAREHSVDFAKKSVTAAELRRARKEAFSRVEAPTGPQPKPKPIRGVLPTSKELRRLTAIHQSTAATAEMVAQDLDVDGAVGLTYSALVAYEYAQKKAELKRRLAKAKDKRRVEAQWEKIVEAAQDALRKAGVKEVSAADLDRVASELTRSKADFNTVVDIANSARDVIAVPFEGGIPTPRGNFLTIYDVFRDGLDIVLPVPPDLCERPIEGRYTKHFSYGFSLSVRITYWCPTWTNPFRTCEKTVTLAGVSFALGLEVGYRITCCGAVAWGRRREDVCDDPRLFGMCGLHCEGGRRCWHREDRFGHVLQLRAWAHRRTEMHRRRGNRLLRQRSIRMDGHGTMPSKGASLLSNCGH